MEEQPPISKPILIIAIIFIVTLVFGVFLFLIDITTPDTANTTEIFESDHNELRQQAIDEYTREHSSLNQITSSVTSNSSIVNNLETSGNYLGLQYINGFVKYLDNGIYKTGSQSYLINTEGKYSAITYGYDFNPYGVMCIYPASWNPVVSSFDAISNDSPVIACYEDSYTDSPALFITEIDISSNQNSTNEQYFSLLRQNIEEYFRNLGYGSASNFDTTDISLYGRTTQVLTYDASLSNYYNYKVYNTFEANGSYMYILTVTIPNDQINDDNNYILGAIINSFEGLEI